MYFTLTYQAPILIRHTHVINGVLEPDGEFFLQAKPVMALLGLVLSPLGLNRLLPFSKPVYRHLAQPAFPLPVRLSPDARVFPVEDVYRLAEHVGNTHFRTVLDRARKALEAIPEESREDLAGLCLDYTHLPPKQVREGAA